MGTKSSHSPRRGARKRSGAPRSRRSSSRPAAPAAPKPQISPAQDAGAARSEHPVAELTKREIEVRSIPLARRFHDCPRCANVHEALEVKSLTRSADGFSHFAMCPNLGEPILLLVTGA